MKQVFFLFAFALLSLAACTDPITVGANILTGDQADVGQIDDLPISVRTVRDDSIKTYRASDDLLLQAFSFSFGQSNDDIFGNWKHSVTITPSLQLSTASVLQQVVLPEFVTDGPTEVDSIVLILPIDTFSGYYGESRTFPVRLTRLMAPFATDQDIYSTYERPMTGEELYNGGALAEASILYDTIYTNTGDTIRDPHMRLKLTQSFVDEINALDSTAFRTDTLFRDVFSGVYLEPVGSSNSFVAFRIPSRGQGIPERSGFYFFYPDPSEGDEASFYRAPLDGWYPRYEHDFSGSEVGRLLAGQDGTRTAVGATATVMTAITFTDLDTLRDRLINRAELTFFREALEGYDFDRFPEPGSLGLFYRNNSGALVGIRDQSDIQGPVLAVNAFAGGLREESATDSSAVFYRNRLTVHLQGIVNGDFAEPTIYLRAGRRTSNPISDPARAILSGPASPDREPTVNVIFTLID